MRQFSSVITLAGRIFDQVSISKTSFDNRFTWDMTYFVWSGTKSIAYKQGIGAAMFGMIKLGWRNRIGDAEAQYGDQNRIHLKLGNA